MSKTLDDLDRNLMRVAVAAALAGIGIIAPGVPDAIIAALNAFLNLDLDLHVPALFGWILLCVGVGLGLMVYGSAHGWLKARRQKFLAVTHTSFPTPPPTLEKEVVRSNRDTVVTRVFDLSPFFGQSLQVAAALRQQMLMISDVRAAQRAGDVVCYGGLVHIPLQLHFGSAVSTGSRIRFFEKNRTTNIWEELASEAPRLGVSTDWQPASSPTSAVVRVSISYLIDESSVAPLLGEQTLHAHIAIPEPRLDCITSYSQLDELSTEFRRVMDQLQSILPQDAEVHLMLAGPACVGVSLGRQISPNIHNATFAYNYVRQSNPPYSWAVLVNSTNPIVREFGDHG